MKSPKENEKLNLDRDHPILKEGTIMSSLKKRLNLEYIQLGTNPIPTLNGHKLLPSKTTFQELLQLLGFAKAIGKVNLALGTPKLQRSSGNPNLSIQIAAKKARPATCNLSLLRRVSKPLYGFCITTTRYELRKQLHLAIRTIVSQCIKFSLTAVRLTLSKSRAIWPLESSTFSTRRQKGPHR